MSNSPSSGEEESSDRGLPTVILEVVDRFESSGVIGRLEIGGLLMTGAFKTFRLVGVLSRSLEVFIQVDEDVRLCRVLLGVIARLENWLISSVGVLRG